MRIKSLLLVLIILIGHFGTVQLLSATTQLGIKAGILSGWTGISGDLPGIELKSIMEFSGGVFLKLHFGSGRLGIQPEILYATKGFDARETHDGLEISSKYKITYFEIPILISYRLFSRKKVESLLLLGPYFGFPGKVREIQTAGEQTEVRELGDNLKKMDFGVVIGFDIRYRLKSLYFILATRYNRGLSNISRDIQEVSYDLDDGDTIKNHSLSVMFGVAINLSSR